MTTKGACSSVKFYQNTCIQNTYEMIIEKVMRDQIIQNNMNIFE